MEKSTNPVLAVIDFLYDWLVFVSNHLQSPFLFVFRAVFGIQLMQAGFGKLLDIQKPIDYFTSLQIPFPVENAWLVGFTETFGGIFLAIGLLSRLTAIPVFINLTVAYLTTEQKALGELLQFNTDDFIAAAPFIFWALALIVLCFGPGAISLDYVIAAWRKKDWKGAKL